MRVLVTNDDGYFSPLLLGLLEALEESKKFTIKVVAPIKQQSAMGHGITLYEKLIAHKIQLSHESIKHIDAYAVDGRPADCTKLALTALFVDQPFDLVISGINLGPNLGNSVFYSGTVAAALEGSMNGVPSIALSLDTPGEGGMWNYSVAVDMAMKVIDSIIEIKPKYHHCFNVNIPNLSSDLIKGIKATKQGKSGYSEHHKLHHCHGGQSIYTLEGTFKNVDPNDEFDAMAVKSGYVSVSLLRADMNNYDEIGLLAAFNTDN